MRLISASSVFIVALLAMGQAAATSSGTGSISGHVLNKDGVAVGNAVVRVVPQGATASFAGRNSVSVSARSDAHGDFVLKDVPTGLMNVVVTWTAADGSQQRGQLELPTEVKAGEVSKLSQDVQLGDSPAKLPPSTTAPTPPGPGRGRRG